MNSEQLKKDFPIFTNDPTLVYLDSAATALKPEPVLRAMDTYYREYSANVSRGLYPLAERATEALENIREKVATFIDIEKDGVIFLSSATHGINLVATGLSGKVRSQHNIVVTELEHHSNFLPWKELARNRGAEFRIVPVEKDGTLNAKRFADYVDENTLIVAVSAISNVLGIFNPVQEIIREIRKKNSDTLVLVDACQAVGHRTVSMRELDCDFLVFSAHKLLGPTGTGILAGKPEKLALLDPVNIGGGTILDPLCATPVYKNGPERFEGGTPNIAGIVGLGAAIDYINQIGITNIQKHDEELTRFLISKLKEIFGNDVSILGPVDTHERGGIVSFTLKNIHPHDIAHILGENNICIRAGEHCARPLHESFHVPASARVSFSVYNSKDDILKLISGLQKIQTLFS